ncbi:hypothetical protein JTE90_026482 [Oedothorax gibbosus]|uniref:HTH psq-type domain-containing protein n=1 Tax=Oedothorax gibbosus TaxID=931172 RepID=A0AAV6VPL4_9ARAC|nr:hypothetical protein JTE90_026482 [Oedothorax gibbosus]
MVSADHMKVVCLGWSFSEFYRFEMSSGKRKRVVSIETKLEAIQRIDNGESIKKVAEDLGVGTVTVGNWKRKRSELEKWCAEKANCSNLPKTMKKCDFEKTSESLFLWFTQLREKGSLLSGSMLQAKALDIHKMFYPGEDFTASSGLLDHWKKEIWNSAIKNIRRQIIS